MGYGGKGRGGSTSRQEDSKEKKESKSTDKNVSADEIRKLVAKFLKELSSNTNPKKAPRLLNKISEETIRALGFMSKLKYVTEPECIDRYIEAEARRKAWFDEHGWEFTPNVDPKRLLLLSYNTVADVNGQTEQTGDSDKHDAFVAFMGTPEGPLRLAEYDKMICAALLAAFGKRTTNSTIKMFADISISLNGTDQILSDVMNFVASLATVTHDLGELEPDEVSQVIEVLHKGPSKKASALELGMRTATEGKGYSVDQWCEILVEKATRRMESTDEFADWEPKSKGNQPVSDAERLRLINLEKENAQLKKEIAQLKATKQGTKSTSATAAGNTGCFTCGQEGHRADRCPKKPGTPATPRTAGAKSAGQSNRKVSFTKLQLDSAVQEAAKTAAQETVAAMAKNGWKQP